VGGALTTISGTANQFIFGGTGVSGDTKQLVLTLVDPADFYSFDVTNTANGLRLETSTPGDGAGPFSNTLDPHIDLFDPSGNLVASGVALADGAERAHPVSAAGHRHVPRPRHRRGRDVGEYFLSRNFRPVVTSLTATSPISENDTATRAARFSDPKRRWNPHTVVIDWAPWRGHDQPLPGRRGEQFPAASTSTWTTGRAREHIPSGHHHQQPRRQWQRSRCDSEQRGAASVVLRSSPGTINEERQHDRERSFTALARWTCTRWTSAGAWLG